MIIPNVTKQTLPKVIGREVIRYCVCLSFVQIQSKFSISKITNRTVKPPSEISQQNKETTNTLISSAHQDYLHDM